MGKWLSVLATVILGTVIAEVCFLRTGNEFLYRNLKSENESLRKENEFLRKENDFLRVLRFKQVPVIITAYERVRAQTDSTPEIGARGVKVNIGDIAISRKLEKDGLLKLGQAVIYCSEGKITEVIVNDRMGLPRKHIPRLAGYVVDVCVEIGQAKRFGVKKGSLFIPFFPSIRYQRSKLKIKKRRVLQSASRIFDRLIAEEEFFKGIDKTKLLNTIIGGINNG